MVTVNYKTSELREKTHAELEKVLAELSYEGFKLRMQTATEQVANPHMFGAIRRNIARVKTIIAEKDKQGK